MRPPIRFLATAALCAGFLAMTGASAAQEQPQESPAETPVVTAPKRFLPAAGELILLEIAPWAFDRYVSKEDFARISVKTVKANFKAGFGYDSDTFNVNQSSHPYHGSLFFAAARSNGYNYWESGAFTLAGSLLWECCMENTRPSLNDLVNTTLGGMTRGEISHRVATIIRDNTATGSSRLWRELGGAFFDPVGALSGGALVSRIEERGVLRGWELTDPEDAVRHVAGFAQEYEYFNNASQVFGAEVLSAGILSRYRLAEGLSAMTDLGVLAVPLAGVQTTNFANPSTGRNYDYGSGGGARVAARVLARGREILTAGYGIV
jgi:hypothetical protein